MDTRGESKRKGRVVRGEKKHYMWLGYGDYSNQGAAPGRMIDGGILRSPKSIDAIMEALGIKEKPTDSQERGA